MNSEQTAIDWSEDVERQALLMDLALDPEHLPGVAANFERIAAIAQLVTDFPLPADISPAPVFQP
ncbi:MAG: DUF4089 domain-containing protein [Hormoscilla sp.]